MTEASAVSLSSAEALQEQALLLACEARRQLLIFTPDLEPFLYNRPAFAEAVLELLKRSKYTEVHILARDLAPAKEMSHSLLRLMRYTDGQLQIRKLTTESTGHSPAYLICDDRHLLRRQNSNLYEGFCYRDDRARVKDQLEEFQLLWNVSVTDPDLRVLAL